MIVPILTWFMKHMPQIKCTK